MKILPAVLVVLTMASLSSAQKQSSADVIFINGDIYTGSALCASSQGAGPCDPITAKMPQAPMSENVTVPQYRVQAIAIANGQILSIGSNEVVLKSKGKSTQVIDLGGHFVMPGFNDAH